MAWFNVQGGRWKTESIEQVWEGARRVAEIAEGGLVVWPYFLTGKLEPMQPQPERVDTGRTPLKTHIPPSARAPVLFRSKILN